MAAMLLSTPSMRSNAPFTFPSYQARAALSCWRARGCPPGPPMYAGGTLEGRFPILGEKSVQHVDRLALRFAYIDLSLPARYRSQPRAPPETVTNAPFSVLPLLPVPRLATASAGINTCASRRAIIPMGPTDAPRRVGLRCIAERPSVPVTRSLRPQSFPVIRKPVSMPSPGILDLGAVGPSPADTGAAEGAIGAALSGPPKRKSAVPVILPSPIPSGPVIWPCSYRG